MIRIPQRFSSRTALAVVALAALVVGSAWTQDAPLTELQDAYPSPELSPEEVVEIQMEAFSNNDEDDTGVAIAFRFASPQNKEMTGPLSRFSTMMRTPAYRPMLTAEQIEYGATAVRERVARVVVTTVASDGERRSYEFLLGKQRMGEFEGAWMTEAVRIMTEAQSMPDRSV